MSISAQSALVSEHCQPEIERLGEGTVYGVYRLLERLENLKSLSDLEHLQQRMREQLGIGVEITPSFHEVKSMRGIGIRLLDQPGLCRKTRQAIPAAIRRGLENHPQIAYELLNAHDLLRDA